MRNIFLELIRNVAFNNIFVSSNSVHKVTPAPKVSISIFIFQIRVSIKYD